MSQYCCLMFVWMLTGPVAVAISSTSTVSLCRKKNDVIVSTHLNTFVLTVSPRPLSLDMQEIVACSDKHS